MDHTALVYLMDKQGRFVAPFNLKRPPKTRRPICGDILSCYRFWPGAQSTSRAPLSLA